MDSKSRKFVVLTKLKRLPATCNECHYKYQAFAGTECYFTRKGIPLKFEDQKRNSDCPLCEIGVE